MTEPNRQSEENEERIIEIEIERLRPFKEHPFQENSGRNHQNHIFCDQHPDYHPNPYEKQHKAEQLFQFFCTFFIGLL